jgi:CHAT domain-containing protein
MTSNKFIKTLTLIGFCAQLFAQNDSSKLTTLLEKGTKLQVAKKYDSSLLYIEEAYQIAIESLDETDTIMADIYYQLAKNYTGKEQLKKGEKYMVLAKESFFKNGGKEDPIYGACLNDLATIYQLMGRYDLCINMQKEAVELAAQTIGKEHLWYGIYINNLAHMYSEFDQYDKALSLKKEVLRVMEASVGKDHSYYGQSLNALAAHYLDVQEYDKALEVGLEAVESLEKSVGKKHSAYGYCLNILGSIYGALGEYQKALKTREEALKIAEETVGKEHTTYAIRLKNLALLYNQTEDYNKAIEMYEHALAIFEKQLGRNHYMYGGCLNDFAIVYEKTRNYKKAIQLQTESVDNVESALGKDNLSYVKRLANLAKVYSSLGRHDTALILRQEVMQQTEKILGKGSDSYGVKANDLAGAYESVGDYKSALSWFIKANENLHYQINQVFQYRSEKEQKAFYKKVSYYFDVYQSFGYNTSNSFLASTEMNLNNQLKLKGLLLNRVKNVLNKLEMLNDLNVDTTLATFRSTRMLLAKEKSLPLHQRKHNLDSLLELSNKQEAELSKLYSERFGEQIKQPTDYKKIQKSLAPEEVAIEFSHFHYYNKRGKRTDSTLYVAYLLKNDPKTLKAVYLFEHQQLAKILSSKTPNELYSTRGAAIDKGTAISAFADSIYSLVWKKLEKELSGVKTIYYATDGLLHQVPFAALGDKKSATIGERFNLVQLSSTANLVGLKPRQQAKKITLIGGVDYTFDTTSKSKILQPQYSYLDSESLSRSSSTNSRGQAWSYLPGTKTEVEAISALAEKRGVSTTLLIDDLPTEDQIKELSGNSPSVLHIATHGFFFENPKQQKRDRLDQELQFVQAEDPLLRSGLLLAGANYAWKNGSNPYEEDDGILTALEISNLDLKNTDLVVLSACETGLGDIDGNEGVYGLQRAFKMAGVESIIMSLWQVPDEETSEFMTLFYENWFEGTSIQKAFNQTQREMQSKYTDEPYKWAAFVLLD